MNLKVLKRLKNKGLINPPEWLIQNIQMLVMMGSVAYGVSDDTSDIDVYGFCIPPIKYIFPHVDGKIYGFDEIKGFEQWQQHHVDDKESRKEYDFSIYGIIKYFKLVMDNNPNMVDSLFVPRRCILYTTQIGEYIRENRKVFLHKGAFHKFKGYAFSQLHKMKIKSPEMGSKRYESVQKHGYDVKFAYHVVRLIDEIEQILTEHDLDLTRSREMLKAIRRGEWKEDQVIEYFELKEKHLEELYHKSTLPHRPQKGKIKKILMECLEIHYGSIDNYIKVNDDDCQRKLKMIKELVNS